MVIKRVTKVDSAVLAIGSEIPIYELLGIDVEWGAECIRENLWNRLFEEVTTKEEYERLWRERLRQLAERALRDTYKIFYYFDPDEAIFISNDNGLLFEGSWGEWEVTLFMVDFTDYYRNDAVGLLGIDELQEGLTCDFIGDYFVLYAENELEDIAKKYGPDGFKAFDELRFAATWNYYAHILALSASVEKLAQKITSEASDIFHRAYYGGGRLMVLLTCLSCNVDTLIKLASDASDVYRVDLEEILDKMGYEFSVVKRRSVDGLKRALGVLREKDGGTCILIVEDVNKEEGMVLSDTFRVSCPLVAKIVKDVNLVDEKPLSPLRRMYKLADIQEFSDEDRISLVLEIHRMRREGRWHGKVDLGRWQVHIVDLPETRAYDYEIGMYNRPFLVILDKSTYKVYAGYLGDFKSMEQLESLTRERRRAIAEVYEAVFNREDAPSELIELLTSIFLFEDLKR